MTDSINARRGAELRALRRALGLTQTCLAVELGTAKNTIARWERGESPIRESALRLARVLSERR